MTDWHEKQISKVLREKSDQKYFSGAALVFGQQGEKLIEVYEGNLGWNLKTPVTSQTQFDLQSITKALVTGPLFLKLLRDGTANLSEPVGPSLGSENLSTSSPLRDITFKQLLTHSSGLSDQDIEGSYKTPEELWKKMFLAPTHFTPGTSIEYTDLGYRLLGKALEAKLGESLDSASQKFLFEPLGLTQTCFNPKNPSETAATPDAHGEIDDEQVRLLGGVTGCDGLFSSAEDLFKLMSSWLQDSEWLKTQNENAVSFPSLQTTGYFETLAFGAKNLGWELNSGASNYSGRFHNPLCFEKAGGAGTFVWMDQKSQAVFVYLTNHGKPKPFDEQSWNELVRKLDPQALSNFCSECLNS